MSRLPIYILTRDDEAGPVPGDRGKGARVTLHGRTRQGHMLHKRLQEIDHQAPHYLLPKVWITDDHP